MDVGTTYQRAVDSFVDRVAKVHDDQWSDPTPCADWDVRALVNHLTYENRWTVPLMQGAGLEEVGTKFDGDLLGADPISSAQEAARPRRYLRWLLPLGFLLLTAWLLWQEIDEFDLIELQRTLLAVPTLRWEASR